MATIVTTTDSGPHASGIVTRIAVDGGRCTLTASTTLGTRTVAISALPDVARAQQWTRSLRRVHRVAVSVADDSTARFSVLGVGHRLPVRRRVAAEVALGLAMMGIPVVLGEERR